MAFAKIFSRYTSKAGPLGLSTPVGGEARNRVMSIAGSEKFAASLSVVLMAASYSLSLALHK